MSVSSFILAATWLPSCNTLVAVRSSPVREERFGVSGIDFEGRGPD